MGRSTGPSDEPSGGAGPPVTHVPADWDRVGPPSIAVIEAVAEATGRAATDLPPLHDVVDSDALDALLTRDGAPAETGVRIEFVYDGVYVTVDTDDGIRITPARPDDR